MTNQTGIENLPMTAFVIVPLPDFQAAFKISIVLAHVLLRKLNLRSRPRRWTVDLCSHTRPVSRLRRKWDLARERGCGCMPVHPLFDRLRNWPVCVSPVRLPPANARAGRD